MICEKIETAGEFHLRSRAPARDSLLTTAQGSGDSGSAQGAQIRVWGVEAGGICRTVLKVRGTVLGVGGDRAETRPVK